MGTTAAPSMLNREDATLAWWTSGTPDGTPVVLVHGGGMNSEMWAPQLDPLGGRRRVVAFDLRGHGRSLCEPGSYSLKSCAADLAAVMDAAGVESAPLVAHSFGASVAQAFAVASPERVQALALVGSACATIPRSAPTRLRAAANRAGLPLLGRRRVEEMFAAMSGSSPDVRAFATASLGTLSDEMFAAVVRTGFGPVIDVLVGYALSCPVMLLYGDHEPYRGLMGNTAAWAARDSATVVEVPDAAHNANQDAPAFVNERLASFLDSLE